MSTSSTTDVADPADVPAPGASIVEEPIATEEQKTDTTSDDNLDTSTSTDDSAEDDKSTDKTETQNDAPASTTFDEDLDEWAEKTGRPKPTTDETRQAYQDLRDSQREYSRTQEAKKKQ